MLIRIQFSEFLSATSSGAICAGNLSFQSQSVTQNSSFYGFPTGEMVMFYIWVWMAVLFVPPNSTAHLSSEQYPHECKSKPFFCLKRINSLNICFIVSSICIGDGDNKLTFVPEANWIFTQFGSTTNSSAILKFSFNIPTG